LGRIFKDLGFEQRALVEGWHSLTDDPANYSAHRLLADSYASRPRHEIARVSELLQSQLLQPLNIDSLQPQLAESSLQNLEGAGPSTLSFNEFNPLFMRDRLALQVNGLVGNHDTLSDDLVISGIKGPTSLSMGQFHYETDGFRPNNDLKHDIYNVFFQSAISPQFNVQTEFRRRKTDQGDLQLRFDPTKFELGTRRRVDQDSVRLGARFSPSPYSNFIASGIYTDRKSTVSRTQDSAEPDISARDDEKGYEIEGRYLLRRNWFNVTLGGGVSDIDVDTHLRFQFPLPFCPLPFCETIDKFNQKHVNLYAYYNAFWPSTMTWSFGLSYESFDERDLEVDKINPKLGVQWDFADWGRLRLAYLRTVKRPLAIDQTIEPTQIAGFNQFFDDINGTKSEQFGAAFDAVLNKNLFAGIEYSGRDLEVPIQNITTLRTEVFHRSEDMIRTYLYWTPHRHWASSVETAYERFERPVSDPNVVQDNVFPKVETVSIPASVRYFHPSGFFAALGGTFVHQKVDLAPAATFPRDSDDFYLMDAALGYRFPKRLGIIRLEARNLLDENFFYQDLNIQTAGEVVTPRFNPDRTVLLRLTLTLN
jgi:outer membrane receptor protein involved in Fe transport